MKMVCVVKKPRYLGGGKSRPMIGGDILLNGIYYVENSIIYYGIYHVYTIDYKYLGMYNKNMFITLEEWRDKQLNKIFI
jgi:hypothetical protein